VDEIATEKVKRYKSPGTDKILAELIQAGGICSEIHKLINSIWNKEEMPKQQKEEMPKQLKESISVPIPIHMKGNKTDCSNYSGISLLLATYKILSSILQSSLTPYVDEITRDHQCVC
jgi:hypothetical protein